MCLKLSAGTKFGCWKNTDSSEKGQVNWEFLQFQKLRVEKQSYKWFHKLSE